MILLLDNKINNERVAFYVGDALHYTIEAIKGYCYKQTRDVGYSEDFATRIVRDNIPSRGTPFEYHESLFDDYQSKKAVEYYRQYYRTHYNAYKAPKTRTNEVLFILH